MRSLLALSLWLCAALAQAVPITPRDDDELIEQLPAMVRLRGGADPVVAVQEARALMAAARTEGDPRLAGRALARLARWQHDATAPAATQLALADAEQYLHRFDAATTRLQALVQREPRQPQAWLTLATLQRVQGRYAASDDACRALQRLQVQLYADACSAENLALRGQFEAARARLQALVATTREPSTRAWLLATLAELEQRAGRVPAADGAWRQSLAAAADGYSTLAYADFLLDTSRPQEAWRVLQRTVRTDAVLLRLAMAAQRAGRPEAAALREELRERFALAAQRVDSTGHEREQALMALEIERDASAALHAARLNVQRQREPLDLLLLARCAAAAGDAQAKDQALRLAREVGLRDVRLESM